MSKQDKQFEAWWKANGSSSKEIARVAFKAGLSQDPSPLRLGDLKPGDLFRLATGVQVYIVCREYNGSGKVFFNAKGNIYNNTKRAEVVRITDHEEFWKAKEL